MTDAQWNLLLDLVSGKQNSEPVTGFIIDSPWLPGWAGISNIEYYASERKWMEANRRVIEAFPDTLFLPGFWSEFGMCTEPSAFGARCVWQPDQLPHAEKVLKDISVVEELKKPDPALDGLLPFMIERLKSTEQEIQAMGHKIRFSVARGPLNIASFLMGTSELMMAMMMQPEEVHQLLRKITDFSVSWLRYQKEQFPSIDGILVLDDIVGFVAEEECRAFALPYLREIFDAFGSAVRFFHNDASGLVSTPFLGELGVNLYNFSFEHGINEIRQLAGEEIVLLGNLPPRDVLAAGTPEQVKKATIGMVEAVENRSRIIWSCGGGMPQGVSTENILTFIETIKTHA